MNVIFLRGVVKFLGGILRIFMWGMGRFLVIDFIIIIKCVIVIINSVDIFLVK